MNFNHCDVLARPPIVPVRPGTKKSEGTPRVEAVYHKNLNGMDSCFLFKLQKVEVKILSLISKCL